MPCSLLSLSDGTSQPSVARRARERESARLSGRSPRAVRAQRLKLEPRASHRTALGRKQQLYVGPKPPGLPRPPVRAVAREASRLKGMETDWRGWRACTFFADLAPDRMRSDGVELGISVWDTEAGLDAARGDRLPESRGWRVGWGALVGVVRPAVGIAYTQLRRGRQAARALSAQKRSLKKTSSRGAGIVMRMREEASPKNAGL